MWLRSPLDDILSSRTKVRLLRTLVTSPTPLTGRELARLTGLAQGNVSIAMRQLVAAGLVHARVVQPALLFSLRTAPDPLVDSLWALFRAEERRCGAIVNELSARIPGLVSLVLFGSVARGTHRSDSDTDLLIVVKKVDAAIEQQITDTCQEISERGIVGLSWIVRDRDQVREWARTANPLWQGICDDGIVLAGSSLARLVR